MKYKRLLIFAFFCILIVLPIQAQENNIANMTPDDYAHLELPSLDILFKNVQNTPSVQINDVKKEEEISLLKKQKRGWLKFISVSSGYNYGILGTTSSYSDTATPIYYQYSGNAQQSYHVGGSIGFSIEELFDLKPNINRQKLKIKEIDLQKEQVINDLKQEIITLYTSILSSISVLKIKGEALAFANAQYKIGENDFLNGRGNANSLNTQKSMQVQALNDYESTRSTLNRDLLKLEILTNTPIVNTNKK